MRMFYPTDFVRTGFVRVTNSDQTILMLAFPFVRISAGLYFHIALTRLIKRDFRSTRSPNIK